MSNNYCWSLGPRIGTEEKPVCFRPADHPGLHQSHPDSGFAEQWGDPVMAVPEYCRNKYWQPA